MRQFHTAVLHRKQMVSASFETHPYEAAWASEAIFFIRIESVEGEDARLDAAVQISVDGVRWVDEGTAFATITEAGDSFVRVRHFGGWLRLRIGVTGAQLRFKFTCYLVLKE